MHRLLRRTQGCLTCVCHWAKARVWQHKAQGTTLEGAGALAGAFARAFAGAAARVLAGRLAGVLPGLLAGRQVIPWGPSVQE